MSDTGLDVGIVGLGVMGGNLARNFARQGYRVGGYNLDVEQARKLAADHPEAKLTIAEDLGGLVGVLERPRRIILMVPAGGPVDTVLDGLDPLLEEGDVVVDAGNSHYAATEDRLERADGRPWHFVGMGVSGGAEGALRGPSIMPGGDRAAYDRLAPVLESIAADGVDGPTVTYCGQRSAGHFVKMVHNGIEYGDMQLIAEAVTILRGGLGYAHEQVADTFAAWNEGELASFLVEITATIFREKDPKLPDRYLVDAIVDKAGQKGTGRWTVISALELGVAIPTITAAVDARVLSAGRELRQTAEQAFKLPRVMPMEVTPDEIRDALYCAKIASYSQGMSLLQAASADRGYGTDLAEVARIWTAGCIIRAALLEDVRDALRQDPPPPILALADGFVKELRERIGSWRKVVGLATAAGIPVPGLSASLAWLETLSVARGSAYVIQAQRDFFGSHTFERLDDLGTAVHHEWGSD
ncbi:MAG: NADP-dependent phosphogluconate dehydrogenase [Sandaracinaceae bacterium]